MKNKKFTIGLVALFSVLVVIVFVLKNFVPTDANKEQLFELGFFKFDNARALVPVPLEDLEGNKTTLSAYNDQWQLVNFGYMFCPDICPVNLQLMSEVKSMWDASNKEQSFDITHITFDPARDTPDRLSQYLNYIDPDYVGFTGELENIRKVAQQLSTVFIHEKPDQYGNYFVTHSDSIAVLNASGEYVGLFKGPYDKENIIKALELVIN
jgi:protein SCO1/2